MAADPNNAAIWANADVYIAPLGTALPADAGTPFGVGWTLVGLLDGASGFVETRTEDVADHFAWGGILVRTSRKNFKLIKVFSVLEDNVTTRSLIWPGSTATQIIVPYPAKLLVAFETRDAYGKIRRLITQNYAQVQVVGNVLDNEADLKKVDLEAVIYPDATGILFQVQGKPLLSSIAITLLALGLSVAAAGAKKLVATATYSDATTADISNQVIWASDTPSKATVAPGGWVAPVAIGTANVSCVYAGVTSTAPSVITVGA